MPENIIKYTYDVGAHYDCLEGTKTGAKLFASKENEWG